VVRRRQVEILMPVKKPRPYDKLTEREHEVAKLVMQGHSNKVIAARLQISEHTAKFHVNNFVVKMNAQTRTDAAVKYALEAAAATSAALLVEVAAKAELQAVA
jgi:DNA-binding NarL/FixJ family response regulator